VKICTKQNCWPVYVAFAEAELLKNQFIKNDDKIFFKTKLKINEIENNIQKFDENIRKVKKFFLKFFH
jgi:hypothetical protein